MMASYLTAVYDHLDEAKALDVIVAIIDYENVQRILNKRVSGWKGYPKFYYPYPQLCFVPNLLGLSGMDKIQIGLEAKGWMDSKESKSGIYSGGPGWLS